VNTDAIDDCKQAIQDALKITVHVRASAEGESGCDGGTCEASGRAKVSSNCSSVPGSPANVWALFALVSAMLANMLRLRNP